MVMVPVLSSKPIQRRMKRCIDVIGAAAGLAVLSPAITATAAAIRVNMGSPVTFRQERPGLEGKIFELIKFRTMSVAKEGQGVESDGARLTPLGSLLRKLSLDELPTLWNVLRGDMSLVGPRPLLVQYLERYSPEQARRHDVVPGVTGWAQINGRNAISWEEKFELDTWYIDNWSFWLDLEILAKTLLKVLKRSDINSAGAATMSEFMGSHGAAAANSNQSQEARL